jgi:hypothetical protein
MIREPLGEPPGQRDTRCINTPTVEDAPRAVRRQLENGPISVQLDQSAAIDGPQQTGTTKMCEGTMPAAAEQGQTIPAELSSVLCPGFAGGEEIVAVGQKLAPSVRGDIS